MILFVVKLLLILLAALILIALIYALFVPIRFQIHSEKYEAGVCWGPLFAGRLIINFEKPETYLEFRIPFFLKRVDLLSLATSGFDDVRKEEKSKLKKTKRITGESRRTAKFRRIINLVKSFKVDEFKWNLDTDDFCLNAQLFPVFYLASLKGYDVSINFCGRNSIDLVIENRLYNILIHYLKPLK